MLLIRWLLIMLPRYELPLSADYLTVSETAKEPPQDEVGNNSPTSLGIEATYINQNFSQQMLLVRAYAHTRRLHVHCAC